MGFKKIIFWIFESIIIISLGLLLAIELNIFTLNKKAIVTIIILTAIIQIITTIVKSINEDGLDETINKLKNNLDEINTRQDESEKKRADTEIFYKEQVNKYEDFIKENEKIQTIIHELIQKGYISNDDVLDSMADSDIYLLYCYANKPVNCLEFDNRKYPQELAKIGFIRLPVNSPTYITTSDVISKNYRNIYSLKKYITQIVTKSLKEEFAEWKTILRNKKTKLGKRQMGFLDSSFDKTMKANIMILRGKINDSNFKSINGIIFNDELMKIFTSQGIKEGIKISKEKKSNIKEFVKRISFESVLDGDKDKIKRISDHENEIKAKLKIDNFIDFTTKTEEDITNSFISFIPRADALVYANQIKNKAEAYKNTFKKLKIAL